MPPNLALYAALGFAFYLFRKDAKENPSASVALWIPALWLGILGSRPFSLWVGGGITVETPEDYLEGSPVDRAFYLVLIIIAFLVLMQRNVDWQAVLRRNRWFIAYIAYCGISVLWSDYTLVGFKRWVKDVGNILMVLLILTEADPLKSVGSVFARCAYLLFPLSVVYIKYFPDKGRIYTRWTGEVMYTGVALEKNALGSLVLVCSIVLMWKLMEGRIHRDEPARIPPKALLILLGIGLWLLIKADSSTALVTTMLGVGIIYAFSFPRFCRFVQSYEKTALVCAVIFVILNSMFNLVEFVVVDILGEDMELTGRTVLWKELLSEPINPLLGTGYGSFWLGPRAEPYWERYYWHPNQAHNGYIETYLNGGLIGDALLITAMLVSLWKARKLVYLDSALGRLQFAFVLTAILYNWTEAVYNRLHVVWFAVVIGALTYPSASAPPGRPTTEGNEARDDPGREHPIHAAPEMESRRFDV
jgi:O-antigen ligase